MDTDDVDRPGRPPAPRGRPINAQLTILSIGMIAAPAAGMLVGLGVVSLRTMLPVISAIGLFLPVLSLGFATMLVNRRNSQRQSSTHANREIADPKQPSHDPGLNASGTAGSERVPPHIVTEIGQMSVTQLNELVRTIEERFGAPPSSKPGQASGTAVVPAAEENIEFNLVLTSAGEDMVNVIKALREITGLGVKEAKDVADSAPKIVKEALPRADAEAGKKLLEEAGATAELNPKGRRRISSPYPPGHA